MDTCSQLPQRSAYVNVLSYCPPVHSRVRHLFTLCLCCYSCHHWERRWNNQSCSIWIMAFLCVHLWVRVSETDPTTPTHTHQSLSVWVCSECHSVIKVRVMLRATTVATLMMMEIIMDPAVLCECGIRFSLMLLLALFQERTASQCVLYYCQHVWCIYHFLILYLCWCVCTCGCREDAAINRGV